MWWYELVHHVVVLPFWMSRQKCCERPLIYSSFMTLNVLYSMSMEVCTLTSDQNWEWRRALYKHDALVKTNYILLNTFVHIRKYIYISQSIKHFMHHWLSFVFWPPSGPPTWDPPNHLSVQTSSLLQFYH